MTLQIEGSVNLDRVPTRRWVSIIAVVIPVGAFVLLAALFVRAYVAPPTVNITGSTTVAAAPPPPTIPKRAAVQAPPPPMGASAQAQETPASLSALPMLATLAAAPPSMASAPPARPAPMPEAAPAAMPEAAPAAPAVAAAPSSKAAEPAAAEPEAGTPVAGPIPMPRSKPHHFVTYASRAIPLPRPKPVDDAAPESDLPAVDRHVIN